MKPEYSELIKLPYEISRAVARAIGHIVVEKIESFVGIEPDLSIDEWRRFEDESIEVNPDEFYERWDST